MPLVDAADDGEVLLLERGEVARKVCRRGRERLR